MRVGLSVILEINQSSDAARRVLFHRVVESDDLQLTNQPETLKTLFEKVTALPFQAALTEYVEDEYFRIGGYNVTHSEFPDGSASYELIYYPMFAINSDDWMKINVIASAVLPGLELQ